jgi:hypothetical protein
MKKPPPAPEEEEPAIPPPKTEGEEEQEAVDWSIYGLGGVLPSLVCCFLLLIGEVIKDLKKYSFPPSIAKQQVCDALIFYLSGSKIPAMYQEIWKWIERIEWMNDFWCWFAATFAAAAAATHRPIRALV